MSAPGYARQSQWQEQLSEAANSHLLQQNWVGVSTMEAVAEAPILAVKGDSAGEDKCGKSSLALFPVQIQ